jgi:hypothetical protein
MLANISVSYPASPFSGYHSSSTSHSLLTSVDDTVDMLLWSATESTVTIMCSSIPVLRPLYVRFRYGSQDESSHDNSYKLPMYGNHSDRKYGNGSIPSKEINGGPSHQTVVSYNANNASDESILRDTKKQNDISGIRRTHEVSVSYGRA